MGKNTLKKYSKKKISKKNYSKKRNYSKKKNHLDKKGGSIIIYYRTSIIRRICCT